MTRTGYDAQARDEEEEHERVFFLGEGSGSKLQFKTFFIFSAINIHYLHSCESEFYRETKLIELLWWPVRFICAGFCDVRPHP